MYNIYQRDQHFVCLVGTVCRSDRLVVIAFITGVKSRKRAQEEALIIIARGSIFVK